MLPGACWFEPSRRSLPAPIVQRSRMPVPHTGDAGSNPARGHLAFFCSRTRLGMRPGCLPGEAGSIPVESATSPSLSGRAPRSYRGQRGFDSSRRDCVARLVASPRAVNPWSRVRFPGDAPRRRAGWAGAALMKRTCVVRFHGRRLHLAVGKLGHPAGFGNRRSLVRLQPARSVSARTERAKRGRGAAVPASLMSSRSWVRIPPAPLYLPAGVGSA